MLDLARQEFQRILIIKPSSLGDIIHALPVLNGLRERYPNAVISWLVNTEYGALLKDHPQLDEVIPFDRQKFKSFFGALNMTFKLGGFAQELRNRRFDLAIDLQGLFRSGLMAFAAGALVRLGFNPAREGAGVFYNHCISAPDANMHAVDKNYLVAKVLNFEHVPVTFHLPVSRESQITARQKLARNGLEPGEPYVLILPGSRWETKNWRPERFSAVIDHIQNELEFRVVVCGSPAEADLCQLIAQTCKPEPVEVAGEINLPELVAVIQAAALVLCHDSAPMHIAAALQKPLLSIFGPTNPKRTGPYGNLDNVLQARLPCVPCYYRQLRQCPVHHECMNMITTSQVNQAISSKLLAKPVFS